MDIFDLIFNYLSPEAIVLAAVLWVIGAALKKTPRFSDWLIIWVVLIVGVCLGMIVLSMDTKGALQGFLAAAVAVFLHNLIKQTKEGIEEIKGDK